MTRLTTFLFSTLLTFSLIKSLTWAQNIDSLPPCAKKCANAAAIVSACSNTDIPCLCASGTFEPATLSCAQTCPKEELGTAILVLQSMCESVTTSSTNSGSTSSPSSIPRPSPPITTRGSSSPPFPLPTLSSGDPAQDTSSSTSPSPSVFTTIFTTSVPVTVTDSESSLTPDSTLVIVSTSTADIRPTNNAAMPGLLGGQSAGALGAMVAGFFVLL